MPPKKATPAAAAPKSPVAVTDVHSLVTLDHVLDPTVMPVNHNLVTDDEEPMDTASDMVLPTQQVVQCSESSSHYNNGMKWHSSVHPEEITGGLENLSLAEKKASMEQVSSEMETSCCDMTLNPGNVRKMVSSGSAVMSNRKQPAGKLQRLNISFRNRNSTNSVKIASACEMRPSASREVQDLCCGDMKDKVEKVGEDIYVKPKLIHQVALGHGSFGSVFKAYDQDTGTLFAIKKVTFSNGGRDEVMKEVLIMTGLCHPNIITLLGSDERGMECRIFLEWMAGGSVKELLSLYGPMSPKVIQRYSEQVLSAIAYLHQLGILHCDVKGANIVVNSSAQVAKLCDFGQALNMPVPEEIKGRGTLPLMAPELFNGGRNSCGSDVWSVGCTMLQMVTGNQPWSEFHPFGELFVKHKICMEELLIPSSLPLLLQEVIANCLQKDVTKRPAAQELQCRLAMTYLDDMSASPYVHDY